MKCMAVYNRRQGTDASGEQSRESKQVQLFTLSASRRGASFEMHPSPQATLTILSLLCTTARSRRIEHTQSSASDSMAEETKTIVYVALGSNACVSRDKGLGHLGVGGRGGGPLDVRLSHMSVKEATRYARAKAKHRSTTPYSWPGERKLGTTGKARGHTQQALLKGHFAQGRRTQTHTPMLARACMHAHVCTERMRFCW
jgi:hypothetical protein